MTLREILVAVPDSDKGVNVGADDDARAKAEDLRKRLLAGEPFAQLASQSSDSGSKANGGLIGPISRDDLSPGFAETAGVDESGRRHAHYAHRQRGYQFIKLENATTAHTKTLDEARAEVSEKLAETRRQSQLEQYLTTPARAGDHRLEERRDQESVRGRRQAAASRRIVMGHADVLTPEASAAGFEWLRDLDAFASRKAGAGSARAETRRRLSSDDYEMEPLERSQEEDRLAALSGLCLRAL